MLNKEISWHFLSIVTVLLFSYTASLEASAQELNISWELSGGINLPEVRYLNLCEPPLSEEEKLVLRWLRYYSNLIIDAEQKWDVDRRAIAGAIAAEALLNVQPEPGVTNQWIGPGKYHYISFKPWVNNIGEEVEKYFGDPSSPRFLPPQDISSRKGILSTPEGSIKYIAATFRAMSDEFTRAGFDIDRKPHLLGFYYHARTLEDVHERVNQIILNHEPEPSNVEASFIATWIRDHIKYLEEAVGPPDKSPNFNNEYAGECKPPIANAGDDNEITNDNIGRLDGSGSFDPDGDGLTYSWEQISGQQVQLREVLNPTSETAKAARYFFVPSLTQGTEQLVFRLNVSDGVYSDVDTVTISVRQTDGPSFTVTTNDDHATSSGSDCTASECTLREAIIAANEHPGRDTIKFNLPADQLTIEPEFTQIVGDPDNVIDLPEITEAVVIDGTTQPGYIGRPIVEIQNPLPGEHVGIFGLVIRANDSMVRGLSIGGFEFAGIMINGKINETVYNDGQTIRQKLQYVPSEGNVIVGNYLGLKRDGTTISKNGIGIDIETSSRNKIGGPSPNERNVISGNEMGVRVLEGIDFIDRPIGGGVERTEYCGPCASSDNLIQGNYIGTDATGELSKGNTGSGVAIMGSAHNMIGGNSKDKRNIISGNEDGIFISGDRQMIAHDNNIEGNYIGINSGATQKLPNTNAGIRLTSYIDGHYHIPAVANTIGGTEISLGNVVSGNSQDGIIIEQGSLANIVLGNYIGTNPNGSTAFGNSANGIKIINSTLNMIGGNQERSTNVISANVENGIDIGEGSSSIFVFNNIIGLSSSMASLGNLKDGVLISDASKNIIGTSFPSNFVITSQDNPYKITVSGDIDLDQAFQNVIGTKFPNQENRISANGGNGVSVIGNSTRNIIEGNKIFANGKLGIDLGNDGVTVNDADDSDMGANHFTNFPTGVSYYSAKMDATIIKGNITKSSNNQSDIIIDLYSNDLLDQSGHGEGRKYIGNWIPDKTGEFQLEIQGDITEHDNPISGGYPVITASATRDDQSTSEFSKEFRRVIPPAADAGPDQIVQPSVQVTLDGTNSTAQDANLVSYNWTQVGGEDQVIMSGRNSSLATFTSPNATSFALLFSLTIRDSNGLEDKDYVLVVSGTGVDDDLDGIETQVDIHPFVFSNKFGDERLGGKTNGSILDRSQSELFIFEETNPNGVRIKSFSPTIVNDISNIGGIGPAKISVCNNSGIISISDDVDLILTCGSVELKVITGLTSADLIANDGTKGIVDIGAGNTLKFDPLTSLLKANPTNLDNIILVLEDNYYVLSPGDSIYLNHPEILPSVKANAGPDMVTVEGTKEILLSGEASFGNITSYSWHQIGGPVLVNLLEVAPDSVTFDAPIVDSNITLVFELTVTNDENLTDTDTVNILVQNIPAWGSEGSDPGEFNGPQGVAVDHTGNVYVADSFNHRIQKFTSTGDFITSWGGFGTQNGRLNYPTDVALDFLSNFNIYIIEGDNDRVQKFSKDNTFLTKWGTRGTALGQFRDAQSITVDSSNNVYVADTINHRIQKFTDAGNFITAWGTFGSQDGQFNRPMGIATDSSNNVYVVDSFNYRVQKFSSTGNFIRAWGEFGSENSQFDRPTGITVDSANNLYVADTFNDRIQVFDVNGSFKQAIYRGLSQPSDIALGTLGNTAYVSDYGNNRIQIFNITHQNGSQQNSPPLAIDQSLFIDPDTSILVNLTATDDNINDKLIFTISRPPDNGTLNQFNGTIGSVVYTPNLKFQGSDSFGFKVSDGIAETFGIISISIGHIPVSLDQTVTTDEDIPVRIQLNGTDIDNDLLSFKLDASPSHGHIEQLNPQNGSLIYVPDANYNENSDPNTKFDTFTYTVSDGVQDSNPSTVKINVRPVNDIPVADNFSITTYDPLYLDLNATDADDSFNIDDDPTTQEVGLTYSIVKQPEHGELGPLLGGHGRIRYLPDVDFAGIDEFTFEVTDGKLKSNIATISVRVKADDKVIEKGDIFVPGLTGVLWFYPNGTFYRHLDVPSPKGLGNPETMAFDSDGNLYVADNPDQDTNRVSKFSKIGAYIGTAIDSSTCLRITDMVFDDFGNIYLGCFYSENEIEKYDSSGNLVSVHNTDGNLAAFSPAFFDLSCDQKTMFYTESIDTDWLWAVKRFDVTENNRLLPDFARLPSPGHGFTTDPQILPDGGLLVTIFGERVYRLDDSGKILKSYQAGGGNKELGALEPDADGKSFWVKNEIGGTTAQEILKVDIASDNVVGKLVFPQHFLDFKNPSAGDLVVKGSYRDALANIDCEFPPIAYNITATTQINTPIDILLTGTDRNKNNTLTFQIQNGPEFGNLANLTTINSTATKVTYVPNTNFTGTDNFEYLATDGGENSNIASVTIMVNGSAHENTSPIARDDFAVTNKNTPVVIDVLANDSDIDGDLISISAITKQPKSGSTSVNSNRSTTYSPEIGYSGSDSFEYEVSDGRGGTDSGFVSIQIKSVNGAPISTNGSANLNEDSSVQIKLNATDPDNDPLIFALDTQPSQGTISNFDSNTGLLNYTPNPNFNGPDSFKFKVNDGQLDSNIATVSIIVKAVNDPPTANDDTASANERSPVSINNLLANDNDLDGDALTIIQVSTPSHGTATINTNNTSVTYTSVADFTGQDSFDYTISDGNGGTATAKVAITVNLVNHAPTVIDQNVVTETNKQVDVTLNGNDPDQGDTLTFVKVTDPSNGVIAGFDTNTGKLSYIPNNGFVGADSFTFKVVDNHDTESNIATVSIQVNALPNNPPVANDQNVQTDQNTPKEIVLTGTDPDSGDVITFVIVSNPSSGQVSNLEETSGKLTYAPNTGFFGSDSFRFKLTDSHGADSNTATVSINVKQIIINNPPDCTKAFPSIAELWPPNHKMRAVTIKNVIDPDRDQVTVKITKILQDEAVNGLGDGDISPDASGIGTSIAQLRSERSGTADGRVYHIYFTAEDGKENGKCNAEILVSVPHDQAHKAVDSGPKYDSTAEVSIKSSTNSDDRKVRSKDLVKQEQNEQSSRQLQEPQSKAENSQTPRPAVHWLTNKDQTEKLLPLTVGNFTINSFEKVVSVLNFGSNKHNIYDNLGAQILTAKVNIKNEVNSCQNVNEAIRHGDENLHSLNYQGAGTVTQELSTTEMKDMIRVHAVLNQFNTQGC